MREKNVKLLFYFKVFNVIKLWFSLTELIGLYIFVFKREATAHGAVSFLFGGMS